MLSSVQSVGSFARLRRSLELINCSWTLLPFQFCQMFNFQNPSTSYKFCAFFNSFKMLNLRDSLFERELTRNFTSLFIIFLNAESPIKMSVKQLKYSRKRGKIHKETPSASLNIHSSETKSNKIIALEISSN